MINVVSTGEELVSYFLQPNSQLLGDDHTPRGYQENGMVEVSVVAGTEALIPSDWSYFIFYSFNIVGRAWPESGTLHIESWVEEWTDDEADILQSGVYTPTNNKYFTAE